MRECSAGLGFSIDSAVETSASYARDEPSSVPTHAVRPAAPSRGPPLSIRLSIDGDRSAALLCDPERPDQAIRFLVPEFRGKTNGQDFAIHQPLLWDSNGTQAQFRLQGRPEDVGMEFSGGLSVGDQEVVLEARVRNATPSPIQEGHHSFLLNTADDFGLHDAAGDRTFVYAETGWASVAQLIEPASSRKYTIRIGASYQAITVMWKLIARIDPRRKTVVAFALDRGYAFASDHPEWSSGLLGGYRWGTLQPHETRVLKGKIYWMEGDLDVLRAPYIRDFKK